jgi:hypothetical protein
VVGPVYPFPGKVESTPVEIIYFIQAYLRIGHTESAKDQKQWMWRMKRWLLRGV